MDPEHKKTWLAALRSGEYEQATSFLRYNNLYCCLGVAAKVCLGGSNGHRHPIEELLNDDALEKLGITQDDQLFLAQMNDNGTTFKDIADYIEEHL